MFQLKSHKLRGTVTESFDDAIEQCRTHEDLDGSQLYGDHETQESEGEEAALHTYFFNCKKNPEHTKFIPVDKFNLDHLPDTHRESDLYDYIKAVAELTVRVDVKMTSPHRPEVWPETNHAYPFSNNGGHTSLRTGSGTMRLVQKFTDGTRQDGYKHKQYTKCWCTKCERSNSPSSVWWEFNMYTATHIVFDDVEASRTALRLFYDSVDCPEVIVDKVCVDHASVEYDMCKLKCVTCDTTLGQKLEKIWNNYQVCEKVLNKYIGVDKLTFIMSHPHGYCKQISVGHWRGKVQVGVLFTYKFTYSTCTCPGSSGASVQCMGHNKWWWSGHIHSGCLKSGLNYSGAGLVE